MTKMEHCWVRTCKNYFRHDPSIELYPLPTDPHESSLWIVAFGLDSKNINSSTRICGLHFRRKYFLNNDTNPIANGADNKLLPSSQNVLLNVVPQFQNNFVFNNNSAFTAMSTSNGLVYVLINNDQKSSSSVELPQVKNISAISSPVVPSPIEDVSSEPQKDVSNLISSEESSNTFCPEASQPLTVDSCELSLYCIEEGLTPEQQKFHADEWMNYVKFTANINDLPNVSAVKGSDVEQVTLDNASQELPVLVYSNATQQLLRNGDQPFLTNASQTLLTNVPQPVLANASRPVFTNAPQSVLINASQPMLANALRPMQTNVSRPTLTIPSQPILSNASQSMLANAGQLPFVATVPNTATSNASVFFQIPSQNSSALVAPNATVTHSNIPPLVLNQPSVFPVKLELNAAKLTDKSSVVSNDEEILPFTLQEDSLTANLLNKVRDATGPLMRLLSKDDKLNEEELTNDLDKCISPDLLCNVEVNFEENDSDSTLSIEENSSNPFCLDGASNNSNGPKIIDILSGDAGANEFFKDSLAERPVDAESKSLKDLDNSSDQNAPPASETLMPTTVSQYSIFSMQKTIAVISSGSIEASIHNLLGVRLHIPPPFTDGKFGVNLRNQLREENFLSNAAWWMIQKRFLPLNPPCSACKSRVFRVNSCFEFLDGLCWTCDNSECRKIYPVKRPKFFDKFPSFSLEELLLLTYHWACKSRIWVIVKDVPVHEERIWSYFNSLQEICGNVLNRSGTMGKKHYSVTFEASAVKLGKFFILCAFDRVNKVSRLQTLTTEEACGSIKHIKILEQWLGNQCTLITWKKIGDEFLPGVTKVSADPAIAHVQSPGRHILNASKYLGKTMAQLFQNINHDQLSYETLQGILNEVQWRERHGKTAESAFWNILNEISRLNDSYVYTEAVLGEISKNRYFHKADINFRLRWGPSQYVVANSSSLYNNNVDKTKEVNQPIKKTVVVTVPQRTVNSAAIPSAAKAVSQDIEVSKRLHPISVVGLAPLCNIPKETELISSQELLSIKITFAEDKKNPLQAFSRIQANNLGIKLKREGFLLNPIRWFVKNKYIKDETSCYVCHGKAKLVDNPKYPEGVSWLCQKTNCFFDNRYRKPSFFATFGFKIEVVLATVFHWAVQSDYSTTTKSIPLNEHNIISIHRKLQKICADVSVREFFKLGGKRTLVEVAFVRFSNCFILGAMERESKSSRFRTFSIETKLHIDEIRKTLISWLRSGSTVIVNSNKYLGRYCMEEKINLVFADKTITDIDSKRFHTLTITTYLQNHIKSMFRSIKAQNMNAEMLQVYLDELVWRERYGKTPVSAFQCIMRDIFAVEYGVTYFTPSNNDVIKEAASVYGFSLPLPEIKIELQRLPDHLIKKYTSPDTVSPAIDPDSDPDEVMIVDDVDPKKNIKVEVIYDSDDDEGEIDVVDVTPAPSAQVGPSTSSSTSNSNDDPKTHYFKNTPKASANEPVLSVNMEDNSNSGLSTSSSASNPNDDPKSLQKTPKANANKPDISVSNEDNSQSGPSTSSSASSPNDDPIAHYFQKTPKGRANKSVLSVNKADYSSSGRYSDKCYRRKKKDVELTSDWKLQCVECREHVTIDHFAKPYECVDCKHNVYTTFCQKSFARHRAYILFGRPIPENGNSSPKRFFLPEEWFCECGYSTFEGNALASHLIKCNKSTCYLNFVKPSNL